jgi:phage shock protein A
MKRFFRWLKAIFNRGMDQLEDPDIMLDQARRDMQESLNSNRERAVQAITQKNRLQQELSDAKKKSVQYESQATVSLQQGNRDLARDLIRQKTNNDQLVASLQGSYDQALQTVESVKVAIKRQEEEVRKKYAEALALKAQWKQAQIQNSISKALQGLTFENQYEGFGAAQERIRNAQSEASARQEMMADSLQGKVMAMEDKAMDYEAEIELQKLEQKLGIATPAAEAEVAAEIQQVTVSPTDTTAPTTAAPVVEVPKSEIDSELEALEQRIQNDPKNGKA